MLIRLHGYLSEQMLLSQTDSPNLPAPHPEIPAAKVGIAGSVGSPARRCSGHWAGSAFVVVRRSGNDRARAGETSVGRAADGGVGSDT